MGLAMVLAAGAGSQPGARLDGLTFLGFGVAMIVGCYLAGPAARFVVTPAHLHIDTSFRRISVPRHLVGTFTADGLTVTLDLTDGDRLDIAVDSVLWDLTRGGEYRFNARCRFLTTRRIVAMLDAVPPRSPSADDRVTTGRRRSMIALAAVTVALTVPLCVIGLVAIFA